MRDTRDAAALDHPPLQVDPFICIYNENNVQGCVDLNNPWYSPSGAVNSDAWYSIYVPVQDFGTAFGATNKINQVRFGHNQVRQALSRLRYFARLRICVV